MKIIFPHKHRFPEYWSCMFNGKSVIWFKECRVCGKKKEFQMPIDNVTPAWEHYQKLKKEFKM